MKYPNLTYHQREYGSYDPPPGEGGQLPRTYRFRPETIRRLDAYCRQQAIWPSSLVEALIVEGLDRLERGDLRLQRRPVMYEIKLAG